MLLKILREHDPSHVVVVFDAPATGHFKTLVDVPAATLQAVLVGPLNHNARKIQDLLMNPSEPGLCSPRSPRRWRREKRWSWRPFSMSAVWVWAR